MTRIEDVADLLGGPNCGCVPGETAACELADAGHLLPDLPTGKRVGDEIQWRLNNCDEAVADDRGGLWVYDDGRMIPEDPMTLRARALIYLAAAEYSERNQE